MWVFGSSSACGLSAQKAFAWGVRHALCVQLSSYRKCCARADGRNSCTQLNTVRKKTEGVGKRLSARLHI